MPTENKKLRSLLREAQEDGMSPDLYERIDAALAEPVENWKQAAEIQEQFKLAAMKERDEALAALEKEKAAHRLEREAHDRRFDRETKCMKERDEARAEVERLKVLAARLYAEAIPGVAFACRYEDLMVENVRDGVRDRERSAHQRGAEAMREAAASLFDGRVGLAQSPAYAEQIRALPTPEDKP